MSDVHRRPGSKRLFSQWWLVLNVVVVLVAGLVGGVDAMAQKSTPSLPAMSSLHVISTPTAAGRLVLVVNVTKSQTLELSAVDPVARDVVWHVPYSTSLETPGVSPIAAVSDGVVVDLNPTQGPSNPSVEIQGINVKTGAVVWSLPGTQVVSDNPLACGGATDFCIPTGGNLEVVDASNGQSVGSVPGIVRAFTVTYANEGSLYQSSASVPSFEAVGEQGRSLWTTPVSTLYGPGFDPNSGWAIDEDRTLYVGSVAPQTQGIDESTGQMAPGGASLNLGAAKTVGFSKSSGALVWTAPGMYQCSGTLSFLTTPVLCQYTGTIHYTSMTSPASPKGIALSLAGFNPHTGAITWHRPVADVKNVFEGLHVPFLDGSHVVVQEGKRLDVLNVANGSNTAAKHGGSAYWCEHIAQYTVVAVTGDYTHGHHEASPTYGGCSATGSTGSGHPSTQPKTVGVTAARMFVWNSPAGLRSVPRG